MYFYLTFFTKRRVQLPNKSDPGSENNAFEHLAHQSFRKEVLQIEGSLVIVHDLFFEIVF